MMTDEDFMRLAIKEAEKALEIDEVPVGAVIVCDGKIIGRGYNLRERDYNPTAHAEIIALKDASQKLKTWHLDNCTLYVTIEPCPMCAGAIVQARIKKLVYGAFDPKAGAAGSLYNIVDDERLNHQVTELKGGVLAVESRKLIQAFFKRLRNKK